MSSHGADGSQIPIPWLKRLRQSGEFSDVIVRVALEEFKLHLLPLLSDSTYFKKQVDADPDPAPNQGPKLVVDLLDFPGGPEIFHVVVDHWYGSMEHEISILNVAKVISASGFLGVESLKNRAFKFLEENVFNCWKSCLAVLATFDCKDGPPKEDKLFDICVDAFLDKITTKNPLDLPEAPDCEFCNVRHLLTVVELLPVNMAKLIYDRILDEAPGLFYGMEDGTTPSALLRDTAGRSVEWEKKLKIDLEFHEGSINWAENLSELLPDLTKRAMLLAVLSASMLQAQKEVYFCKSFLCLLLVKMVEASEAMVSIQMPTDRLDLAIEDTEWLVGLNMDLVQVNILQKCKFATILSMVKTVKSWWQVECDDKQENPIDEIAKVLDACLLAHLKHNSLSVAQVLLIYHHYPNDARSSHADLYNVFKEVLQSKTVSYEQRQDLRQMLDFQKLPERWVKRIFEELELDHEPRLLKRVLEIHKKHAKRIKINEPFATNTDRACSSFLKESLVLVKHFNAFMTAKQNSRRPQIKIILSNCPSSFNCNNKLSN